MAVHFALRAATRLGLIARVPTPQDLDRLVAYTWPGNVRELAAVIERAAILGNGGPLEIATALGAGALPVTATEAQAPTGGGKGRDQTPDQLVRDHVEAVLSDCLGRIEGPFGAARRLGMNPRTLRARMRRLGIDWRLYRASGR